MLADRKARFTLNFIRQENATEQQAEAASQSVSLEFRMERDRSEVFKFKQHIS